MIILRKPQDHFRAVELAPGAILHVRPATSFDYEAARQRFAKLAKAAADTAALAAEYGLPFAAQAEENADLLAGLHQTVFWTELALLCTKSWQGFGLADGTVAELNRETMAAVMINQTWQTKIILAIGESLHELVLEGNGSTASRNGAPGAEMRTAPAAPGTESPAPPAPAIH